MEAIQMCNYKDYTEKDFDMSSSTDYVMKRKQMLSSNDPYNPEYLLHRVGKIFRSVLSIHCVLKAA